MEIAMLKKLMISLTLAFALVLPAQAIQNFGTEENAEVVTYVQPNEGTPVTFDGKLWGNSLLWEQETTTGYTFVLNEVTGYWCYAILNSAGYYVPSLLEVGIDNPVGISQHLRRSAACLVQIASLQDDFDDMVADAYDASQLRRDQPDEYELAILFFEFEDIKHKHVGDVKFTQENVELMFISEGVYKGVRSDEDPPATTPEGEEPFGSVRDWFLDMSSGFDDLVTISAGGPFGDDDHDLIINEIDDGEIVWVEMPWDKTQWGDSVIYPGDADSSKFNLILVRRKAAEEGLINWAVRDTLFDRLIYIPAGGWQVTNLTGWAYRNGDLLYSELQGRPAFPSLGESLRGYNPAAELLNIGELCHELMHACEGVPDTYDNSSAEVMMWGAWRSPFAEYDSYDDPDTTTCTYSRSTCPPRPNPQFLAQSGWVNLQEITGDSIGENQLVITYSLSEPKIYYFDYDVSNNEGGEGRFYLENRHMVTAADEDSVDFNSYSMGSYDWGVRRPERHATGDTSNLHIWHREGWKDVDFTMRSQELIGGIMLENADGNPENGSRGDGDDLFPGADNIEEFGPGTGEHHEFFGDIDEDNFLYGSSRDVIGIQPDLSDYRELQTGFCVKEITADGDNITCDVYTNYWGGDIEEDLTLMGDNLYLGQNPVIEDGFTVEIRPINPNEGSILTLDSEVIVESGASLIYRAPLHPNFMLIHTNGYDVIVEAGGEFDYAIYDDFGERQGMWRTTGGGDIIIRGRGNFAPGENNEVYLSSGEQNPGPGDWGGIVFEDVTEVQTISNVTISHTINGITVDNCGSKLTFENVTVTEFGNYGFRIVDSSPTLDSCSASNSTQTGSYYPTGLYCYNSSPKIVDCSFDNNYRGVEAYGVSSCLDFGHSSVSDNDQNNIYIFDATSYLYYSSSMPDYGYNVITGGGVAGVSVCGSGYADLGYGSASPGYNSIYDNTSYEVANYTVTWINAEYNWWGDISGPDSIYGDVDYDPWLASDPNGIIPKDDGVPVVAGFDDGERDPFHRADSLFNRGNFNAALRAYQDLIAENPDDRRIINVIRMMRRCYARLDRRDDWRDAIGDLNDNRQLRAQLRPMVTGLFADEIAANGEAREATVLLGQTLNDLNRNHEAYPSLMFQMAMIYAYKRIDVDTAIRILERLIELFEDHPLCRVASMELASLDDGDIDAPDEPEELVSPNIPTEFELFAPYPNPFNDVVTIRYAVPELANVRIVLFDVLGRKVQELTNKQHKPGIHRIRISGVSLNSGIYFCKMQSSNFEQTEKLIYLK